MDMPLSDRERRLLTEIEEDLRRRDRSFARHLDALSSVPLRRGPQRFACYVSLREIISVLLFVVVTTVLLVVVTLAASRRSTPAPLDNVPNASTSPRSPDVTTDSPGQPRPTVLSRTMSR